MHVNFASWCEVLFLVSTQDDLELFAYITWQLWNLRNDSYHGKNCSLPPYNILSKATILLHEFKEANKNEFLKKVNRKCTWHPPPAGLFKLNTDGALDLRRGRRGFGAVIRNDKGELMGASAQCVLGSFSILATELMAVKAGLCFAIDMGLIPTMVEVDSSEVAYLVNSSDQCWAEERFLVEIKNLLKVCSSSNVIFQPRECNIVAHGLAKSSLLEIENMYCIEHGPE